MATGYKKFSVAKTIVLPIPEEFISVQDYKDKYGIDLKELVEMVNGHICLNLTDNIVFLRSPVGETVIEIPRFGKANQPIFPITACKANRYISGSQDGAYVYGVHSNDTSDIGGIEFRVDNSVDFDFDHLTIGPGVL